MKNLYVLKKFSFVILSTFLLFGNLTTLYAQIDIISVPHAPQIISAPPVDILIGSQVNVINHPPYPGGTTLPHFSEPCTAVAYPVQFNLGGLTNGMVIQEVVFTRKTWDCTTNQVNIDTTIHYFEGWPVDSLGVMPVDTFQWPHDSLAPKFPYNDVFLASNTNTVDLFNGARGCMTWTGKYVFVPNNPDGTPPVIWTPGTVTMAGPILPSTPGTNPPPFWDDLINSGTYRTRTLSVCWNCCPGEPQQWDVTSTYDIVPMVIVRESLPEEELISEELMDFKIYPNPAKEMLQIATDKTPETPLSISIFNIQGQSVMNQRLHLIDVQTLDISSFLQGMYVLTVKNDKGQILYNARFLKQ